MATKVGTLVILTLSTKEMVGEMSTSLATAVNVIDISSKASGRATNVEYGRITETLSVSSIATTDGSATSKNWEDLHADIVAGTKVPVVITEYSEAGGAAVAGAINIAGTAVLSNLNWDIPDNDKQTFSCDMTFDGAITKTVNA